MIIIASLIVYVTRIADFEAPARDCLTPTTDKVVALTFDDGPRQSTTARVLEELEERNVVATFFVLGQCAKGNADLLRRMDRDGMEIGNHTFDHRRLTALSQESINGELDKTKEIIFQAANAKPKIMRPPGGWRNDRVNKIIAANGLSVTMWTLDPQDWKHRNSGYVAEYVLSHVKNYDIILLHDIHASTAQAVPQILDGLIGKGYRFVTVSELNALKPKQAPSKKGLAAANHKRTRQKRH